MNIAKNIVLGVTGGIACYKAAELVRLLRAAGAEVQVIMTQAAQQFITPMTLQALSGRPVRDSLFGLEAEHAMSHIELARWADLVLIAPATAHCVAKLAHGYADDLLSTVCLATRAPVFVAPAMNQQMWQHPITQRNVQALVATILGPGIGEQACGETGPGRMLEPVEIVAALKQACCSVWRGKKVMITAGPTREALDPVRCFTNLSSGKMGYALAAEAAAAGATVTLVSGPTALPTPPGVTRVSVTTALEMLAAVQQHIAGVDVFIAAAAVADYRPQQVASQKIKKGFSETLTVELIQNPDIVRAVAQAPERPPCVVGFAAESEQVLPNATRKLQQKQLDWVVANDVSGGQVFDADQNEGWLLAASGEIIELPRSTKQQFARLVLAHISTSLDAVGAVCYDSAPYS